MKVSLNTIRGLSKRYGMAGDVAAAGVDALAEKIGAQLGAVEGTDHIGGKYQGIVVAKVMQCEKHTDSDHLNVCRIDDGGAVQDVERGADGLVQVVCGAPNVRPGILVAWLPPGSTVPESVGKDPFVLSAREIRGQKSNGMLASLRELALGDNHDGILEIIDPFDRVHAGDGFAEAFELKDDVVFDIENKMFTHRPDCFGFLGISRELAGIQGMPFKSPEWYRMDADIPAPEAKELPLEVHSEVQELVPRFTALALSGVQVGPSPTWLVVELAKVGLRSINNIVDYTNFFMLETGQPLHAYDYDKVKALSGGEGASLVVRHPRQGEKITLLNGKTIVPREEAIMIATDKALIGVGGVMGGADTEVDETTRNIILEVANFDMYSIRRTSMAHGLFTDAVTRFNKGQSPLQNRAVMAKITDEIRRFAGGKVAGRLIDVSQVEGRAWVHPPVSVAATFVNARLGLALTAREMKQLLENVECKVELNGDNLTVTAPFWRTDIELREDVVEEVGRLYGFDKLPLALPQRSIEPAAKDRLLELKSRIRAGLAEAGANEVLSYSFVHGDLLQKVGQDAAKAFQVSNALSPDLQYYRLSLTPSLLANVHPNIKAGYDEFALFEIGKAHMLDAFDTDGLPLEFERLALVYAAAKRQGAAYYEAKQLLLHVLKRFGLADRAAFRPLEPQENDIAAVYYEPSRAATIVVDGQVLGRIGEYKAGVRRALKLPEATAGFELGLMPLVQLQSEQIQYEALPRFPKVTQDITLKVDSDLPYGRLYSFMQTELAEAQAGRQMLFTLQPLDIYQRADSPEHKHVTFRLNIASYTKTLQTAEVDRLLELVATAARMRFNAERV